MLQSHLAGESHREEAIVVSSSPESSQQSCLPGLGQARAYLSRDKVGAIQKVLHGSHLPLTSVRAEAQLLLSGENLFYLVQHPKAYPMLDRNQDIFPGEGRVRAAEG